MGHDYGALRGERGLYSVRETNARIDKLGEVLSNGVLRSDLLHNALLGTILQAFKSNLSESFCIQVRQSERKNPHLPRQHQCGLRGAETHPLQFRRF